MKAKLKFIIPIVIAIIAIIVVALCIDFTPQESVDVSSLMSTAQKYLIENQYEQAIAEFNKVIEIEPMNVDAYLGLAEAYVGIGDTDKAIEVLEKGYEITGDDRLKEMLDRLLLPVPEETMVTTTAATEETTTVSTATMVTVPDLSGLTEEEAIAACESAGLNYSVSYDYSDVVENDYVMGQTIPANSTVANGVSVSFTVSKGAEVVTVATTTTTAITTTTPVTTTIKLTTTTPAEEFIIIKGEKYSTSLTQLFLSDKNLSNEDIKELYKMTNLTSLSLSGNQISDISALKNLTNLTWLSLYNNQIDDISALKKLTNLTCLDLNGNQISDISTLKKLTNLKVLALDIGDQVNDISALKNLTNLEMLTVFEISEKDLRDLRKSLPNCKLYFSSHQ